MMENVSSSEKVARILNPEWIEDGILMHEAFMLRDGETYISVNRPSVDSYDKDVTDFVNISHMRVSLRVLIIKT